MVIWIKCFQNESMVETLNYSLSLTEPPNKTYEGDGKWPLFVNKQLFWWSASMILDNNNDVLPDFQQCFSLYTLPHISVGLTVCISIIFSVFDILTYFTTI